MMSVRFLPSTLSWKTHMVTSSSNWSRSSTLRPTILAMAEPQLPEPTMQTFSFCRGQGEELTHRSVCRGGRLPYSACLLATTQAQALKTSSRGRSQHSREEHDAQHSCRACERDECTVSRVASTRSCNATTADAPSGMHRGQAKNELRSALRIGTDATGGNCGTAHYPNPKTLTLNHFPFRELTVRLDRARAYLCVPFTHAPPLLNGGGAAWDRRALTRHEVAPLD